MINKQKERVELEQIEHSLKKNIQFCNGNFPFENWEVGTDTKYRTGEFNSMTKAKLTRMIMYLDSMAIDTITFYNAELIDLSKYKMEMFLHCSMLMSIMDTCKIWGWKITRNWNIK